MAHVGKNWPVIFYRDWAVARFNSVAPLAWQYGFTGNVNPTTGRWSGWRNNSSLSGEPVMSYSPDRITWEIPAPPGADPDTFMRIYYTLNHTISWYTPTAEGFWQGVWDWRSAWTVAGHNPGFPGTLDPPFVINNARVPPLTFFQLPFGNVPAATWSMLGVTEYPGHA